MDGPDYVSVDGRRAIHLREAGKSHRPGFGRRAQEALSAVVGLSGGDQSGARQHHQRRGRHRRDRRGDKHAGSDPHHRDDRPDHRDAARASVLGFL